MELWSAVEHCGAVVCCDSGIGDGVGVWMMVRKYLRVEVDGELCMVSGERWYGTITSHAMNQRRPERFAITTGFLLIPTLNDQKTCRIE